MIKESLHRATRSSFNENGSFNESFYSMTGQGFADSEDSNGFSNFIIVLDYSVNGASAFCFAAPKGSGLTASVAVLAGLHVIFTMGTGYACGYYFLRALFPHDYTLVRTFTSSG